MELNLDKNRTVYFDHLRVLATIAVMMLHVAASNWGAVDVNGADWRVFNVYDSLVRWGVPVFIMISGALFLSRDDIPIQKIYSKYVLRMAAAYIAWSVVYYLSAGESVLQQLRLLFQPGKTERWITIVKSHYHLWFVTMIAGLYMCIPILRQIVKNEKVSTYFLTLSFLFWMVIPQCVNLIRDFGGEQLISIATAIYGRIQALQLGLVMNCAFYFILGYRLAHTQFQKKTRCLIYALGILGFAFTIVADWAVTIRTQTPTQTYYGNTCVNIMLEAVAVFELYKNIPFRENRIYHLILRLSKWSFGAYLVHALVIEKLAKLGLTTLSFRPVLAAPLIVLIVFVISNAISAVLHRIPIVNKYIV